MKGTCISGVRFGNILADSAPVIVDVKDAEAGTDVIHAIPQQQPWGVERDPAHDGWRSETTVTFDITGLTPSKEYEVETSLDNGFAAQSTGPRLLYGR